MKTFVIYYFSGTGNTWWIANEIKSILTDKGHDVIMHAIENISQKQVEQQVKATDHIIVGFAVIGSTAHKNMRQFIDAFPVASSNKPISIFATHALASGDSAYHIGQKLVKKGYILKQTAHFRMMNNFHLPKFPSWRPRNDDKLDRMLTKAKPKVKAFAQCMIDDKTRIIGHNPIGHLGGSLQRLFVDKLLTSGTKEMFFDQSRCIDCGKCVRICPTKNIRKLEGQYAFDKNCVFCLRCYSQCPKDAILICKGSENELKYPRYRGPGKDFRIENLLK